MRLDQIRIPHAPLCRSLYEQKNRWGCNCEHRLLKLAVEELIAWRSHAAAEWIEGDPEFESVKKIRQNLDDALMFESKKWGKEEG